MIIIIIRRILLIFILTGVMILAVLITDFLLTWISPADSKVLAFMYAVICAGVGGTIYGVISYKLGLAQALLGDKITKIARKLRLVK